ncbi:hypothetical protein [Mucilaginibacter psychrotolerans]|uniref:Uncharacterized protein n=1 Tax=Mucilaginibacter psychrotolerans TaxID=1524096 RepID=A0A4Y8SDW3_9SPHI|nr:hypothetical protein [Mucilaginibacter psychrotolerans]TFF36654.1 hypothetical protein E2R66_14465 [Mucilaginibacter psychrotolerans]
MISKEQLEATYATLPTNKLLAMMDNTADYTELAIVVASAELAKRNVGEAEKAQYEQEQLEKADIFIQKVLFDELSLLQKNLFYFLWFPILNFAFKMNFRQDGYLLKLKQANYYSLVGFIFFMLAGILEPVLNISDFVALSVWILGFVVAYFFDQRFNKQRIVRILQQV